MMKRIIIAIAAFFVLSTVVLFYVLNTSKQNIENARSRTESDFTMESFVIDQIWEMQKVRTEGLNDKKVLQSYIYLKPRNEDFNLRFYETDVNGKEGNKDKILSEINEGDQIDVKVLKNQIEEARKGGIFSWIKRFIQGDRREVSIYKLDANGVTVSENDINLYDVVESSFMDRFDRTALFLAFAFMIIFFPIVGFIKRKREIKNTKANN